MPAFAEKMKSLIPGRKSALLAKRRDEANNQVRSQIQDRFRNKYKSLVARFDSAQDTPDSSRHWMNADSLSAESAANPAVRAKLRNRSRYETQENNCYGKGILIKHSNNLVGRVPKLQVHTPDEGFNDFVESHFEAWSKAVCLGRKLRTMAKSKTADGEAFAQLVTNERLIHGVKLDLRLIEAEQVATPWLTGVDPNYIDGIKFDQSGLEPIHYDVLPQHPGASLAFSKPFSLKPVQVPASEIIHWFREDRPNQKRGIPETAPALSLFSQLRRFTLATIAAAETAAEMAGVVKTTASDVDTQPIDPMEAIEIEMRSLLTLPEGWDISQIRAEHPTTTFEMFERAIVTQMSQVIAMPYNVASGDSSRHNFASGRLDHKMYESSISVERHDFECSALRKILASWYLEFKLWARATGAWKSTMPAFDALIHSWTFDAADHAVDPSKDATGESKRLAFGGTSLPELYARRGMDYRREMRRGAKSLGVEVEEYQALIRQSLFGPAASGGSGDKDDDLGDDLDDDLGDDLDDNLDDDLDDDLDGQEDSGEKTEPSKASAFA